MAAQFRARVLRQRSPFRRAEASEPFLGLAQGRPEGENAEAREDGLHLVHDPGQLAQSGAASRESRSLQQEPPRACAGVLARSRGSARAPRVAAPDGGTIPRACSPATESLPPCGGPEAFEPFLGLAQGRPEGENAEAREDGLHLVHDPGLFADKILSFPAWPPRILLLNRRDRDHAAMALLAAQPAEKGAHQEFRIEAIGLRAPMFARYRDACGMDNINFDIPCSKPAR